MLDFERATQPVRGRHRRSVRGELNARFAADLLGTDGDVQFHVYQTAGLELPFPCPLSKLPEGVYNDAPPALDGNGPRSQHDVASWTSVDHDRPRLPRHRARASPGPLTDAVRPARTGVGVGSIGVHASRVPGAQRRCAPDGEPLARRWRGGAVPAAKGEPAAVRAGARGPGSGDGYPPRPGGGRGAPAPPGLGRDLLRSQVGVAGSAALRQQGGAAGARRGGGGGRG